MAMGRTQVVMTTGIRVISINTTTCMQRCYISSPDAAKLYNKNGFTLIEVMISLTILTFGILGISGMLLIGEKGISTGNKSLSAVQITRLQMESLKGNSAIETGNGDCTALPPPDIHCQWTIRNTSTAADLFEIEVRASWSEGQKKRELVLQTMRFIK